MEDRLLIYLEGVSLDLVPLLGCLRRFCYIFHVSWEIMENSVVKLELELLEFFIQSQLCFDAPVPEDHRHWVVGLVIEIFASNQLDILALLQL